MPHEQALHLSTCRLLYVSVKTISQVHFIKEFPDAGVLIALEDQESVAATVREWRESRTDFERRKWHGYSPKID